MKRSSKTTVSNYILLMLLVFRFTFHRLKCERNKKYLSWTFKSLSCFQTLGQLLQTIWYCQKESYFSSDKPILDYSVYVGGDGLLVFVLFSHCIVVSVNNSSYLFSNPIFVSMCSCHSRCDKCDGPDGDDCTGCLDGFVLTQRSCLPRCNSSTLLPSLSLSHICSF